MSLGTELSAAGREGMERGIALLLEELAGLGVRPEAQPLAAAGGG